MNVADVFPARIVTEAGVVAEPLALRLMTNPPIGAVVPIVTVPVEVFPPTTDVGLRVSDSSKGGLIVSVPLTVFPFSFAEIVATVIDATETVFTVNVALVFPLEIVTIAGTVAAPVLLLRLTTRPLDGASLEIVTVPVEDVRPTTVVGLSVTDVTVGGSTVRTAVTDAALSDAKIVAEL